MDTKWRIRPGNLSDFLYLMHLEGCFPEVIRWKPDNYIKAFSENANLMVATDQAGTRVGVLVFEWVDQTYIDVINLTTDPAYRHRGIGEALMKWLIAWAVCRAPYIGLEVNTTNGAARALYEKLGFVVERTIPGYYQDGADAYRMRLPVRA